MEIPLDEVVYADAITNDPSTGETADADSTPSFAVYEEATDTAIVTGSFTKRTSLTGNYRATFTASAANGFEVGKWYSVIAAATVGGLNGKTVLQSFRCVSAEATVGSPVATLTSGERTTLVTAIWSYLKATAAGLATTTMGRWLYDILEAIKTHTDLITSGTAIQIANGLISDSTVLVITRGETRSVAGGNAITLTILAADATFMDSGTWDCSLGFRKIGTKDGTDSFSAAGSYTGTAGQNRVFTFEMSSIVTSDMALNNDRVFPNHPSSTGYAYALDILIRSGATCRKSPAGKCSVIDSATDCEGA